VAGITIRDIFIAFGYKVDKNSEKKANDSISTLKSTATKLLGAIGIGFSLIGLKDISEEYQGINNKIRDAVRGLQGQDQAQAIILKASQDTTMSYADMADTVSKLAQNNDVFTGGVQDAADFAGLMAKNFIASGKSESEAASLMQSITTSMSKGAFDSRSLMTMFRDSPGTIDMLAKSLGLTSKQFQDMASKGKITAQQIKKAFEASSDDINSRFGDIKYTISDAMRNIRDQWGNFISGTDEAMGISESIGTLMVKGFTKFLDVLKNIKAWVEKVSKKVGGMKNLLKIVAGVAATIFIAMNAGKILSFMKTFTGMLSLSTLKVLALVAVFLILYLIIDDLVAFMQGRDSLFGEALKNAGIDADDVRTKITTAFETVKTKVVSIWTFIKTWLSNNWKGITDNVINIFSGIATWFSNNWELIKSTAKSVWTSIKLTLATIWGVISGIFMTIFGSASEGGEKAFGEQLGGGVTTALEKLRDFSDWISEHQDLIRTLTELILGIMDAVKIFNVVMATYNAVMAVAAVVTDATLWPILLVIAAIVALIVIIYLLITHWDEVTAAATACWEWIKGVWNAAAEWFDTNVIQPIAGFFSELWDKIKEIWETVSSWFNDNVIQPLKDFFQGFKDKVSDIWDSIKSGFDDLVDGFKTGIDKIVDFFQPFIDIINKVNDFVGGAMQKVGDFAGEKWGQIKGFFTGGGNQPAYASGSNNTPDTFIAGEQGPELITGQSGRKIFTAAQTGDIFNTLKSIVAMGSTPRPGTMAAATSGVENKSIVQNVQITNQFNGDRAGQQKSAQAMNKAAEDATGYMSRGLAYVR